MMGISLCLVWVYILDNQTQSYLGLWFISKLEFIIYYCKHQALRDLCKFFYSYLEFPLGISSYYPELFFQHSLKHRLGIYRVLPKISEEN